jgi:pyruvate formate lyase activating enzyme
MLLSQLKSNLGLETHPARFFQQGPEQKVQCFLCPRGCHILPDRAGFCKVRWNESGQLKTINYGVSVQMTEEVIETEAVLHYSPGARILSLGNIGCMMNCDYCHNWRTSQIANVEKKDIFHYTPEQVVQAALDHQIEILSWTYNDPVVWHEFVVDTARLAKKAGLKNLYKSAFYIGPEAVDELLEVMDIFSLSLKSMDPEYYLRLTKGKLAPVLEAIKQVYKSRKAHLEVSNLVVTEANDNETEVRKVVEWMLKELDASVPLHLVRFHPDYKYTKVGRTSIEFLKKARRLALDMGLQHVYLGNVFEHGEWLQSACKNCGSVLVDRFGMRTEYVHLQSDGSCSQCGTQSSIMRPQKSSGKAFSQPESTPVQLFEHHWSGDLNSGHVLVHNLSDQPLKLWLRQDKGTSNYREIPLAAHERWRFIVSRRAAEETGFELLVPPQAEVQMLDVLDRAHFPTGT